MMGLGTKVSSELQKRKNFLINEKTQLKSFIDIVIIQDYKNFQIAQGLSGLIKLKFLKILKIPLDPDLVNYTIVYDEFYGGIEKTFLAQKRMLR